MATTRPDPGSVRDPHVLCICKRHADVGHNDWMYSTSYLWCLWRAFNAWMLGIIYARLGHIDKKNHPLVTVSYGISLDTQFDEDENPVAGPVPEDNNEPSIEPPSQYFDSIQHITDENDTSFVRFADRTGKILATINVDTCRVTLEPKTEADWNDVGHAFWGYIGVHGRGQIAQLERQLQNARSHRSTLIAKNAQLEIEIQKLLPPKCAGDLDPRFKAVAEEI